jgi:predicted ArsR family transcriptional regulator
MDPIVYGQRSPAFEILRLIQQRGPQSIKSLEVELHVTTNAVREQIQSLLAAGLLVAEKERRGAGRPAYLYSLTEKAQRLFPQPYDVLLKLLIEEIVRREGADTTQQLLNAVGERMADGFSASEKAADLREQLEAITTDLARQGMPITILEQDEAVALQSWSCPYISLARETDGVCQMAQHMLERALGTRVTVDERLIDGHTHCRFVVHPRDGQAAGGQDQARTKS